MTQGLADLAMTHNLTGSSHYAGVDHDATVVNPNFSSNVAGACAGVGQDEEEFEFDSYSDDALSDDVFLDDNPMPHGLSTVGAGSSSRSTYKEDGNLQAKFNNSHDNISLQSMLSHNGTPPPSHNGISPQEAVSSETEESTQSAVEQQIVEALRKNSVQSKLRQTWRHRRSKAKTSGGEKANIAMITHQHDHPVPASTHHQQYTEDQQYTGTQDQQYTGTQDQQYTGTQDQQATECCDNVTPLNQCHQESCSSGNTDAALPYSPNNENNASDEVKPSFYYVVSPTDDVNMPGVIAVRKSSVELIKWQNSLRRRRRRQAKRHDLGRSSKKDTNSLSATV
jgi:hypothetical protein